MDNPGGGALSRSAFLLSSAILGLTASFASRAPAQSPSSQQAEADSAGALSAMVDRLIADDSTNASLAPRDRSEGLGHPSVWVRIGRMRYGAWAAPNVARLRAWHWFYNGWAIDSTRAIARRNALPGMRYTPFPVELSFELRIKGDSADVVEYWDMQTCESQPGLRGIIFKRNRMARTPSGWRWVDSPGGGSMDVLCR